MHMNALAIATSALLPMVATAAPFACHANVTNLSYDITLDTTTLAMNVVNNYNVRANGTATHFYDATQGRDYYFLATGFGSGMEIDMQAFGSDYPGFCFSNTECYGCRPK